MEVAIWSDIRCPFCYIGKRKFETALEKFAHKDKVKVVWHSFELDPSLKTDTEKDVYDYLAERKGQTREWSVQMHKQVTETAKEAGLTYNFEKSVIANSFNAHRLIQLAKHHNLGDAAEEQLFNAYFTEGKNIDDNDMLTALGIAIGLPAAEVENMLSTNAFADEVYKDQEQANAYGITGVPFFAIDNKYGVSGAQAPEVFLQALQHAWTEHVKENPEAAVSLSDGASCGVDGAC